MTVWIAWRKGLPFAPEVNQIATALGIDRWEAACRCMMLWEWADTETDDGFVPGGTLDLIDAVTGLPGFGEAIRDAGWIVAEGNPLGLQFPNWARWNLKSAKARAQNRERQRRFREARAAERAVKA